MVDAQPESACWPSDSLPFRRNIRVLASPGRGVPGGFQGGQSRLPNVLPFEIFPDSRSSPFWKFPTAERVPGAPRAVAQVDSARVSARKQGTALRPQKDSGALQLVVESNSNVQV